ncbi:hypothetical protein N9M10_04400 [Hellea sp.]|nr:hypothetical protein [Hellea sp.]
MTVILGIHATKIRGKFSHPNGPSVTQGHAWITVTKNNFTQSYSVWPDYEPKVNDNGWKGSDLRKEIEVDPRYSNSFRIRQSRYFQLNMMQQNKLNVILQKYVFHRPTHNCASWVAEVARKVTSENVRADEKFHRYIESPRQMGAYIQKMETKTPSSLKNPILPS